MTDGGKAEIMFPRLKLPPRIGRLDELAHNLWWSWHAEARELFRALDYQLWRVNNHNPVKQLCQISPDRLRAAANDLVFLILYDKVMAHFDADSLACNTWAATRHPRLLVKPIAYFSPEFAFHTSLPIYAGGLGVLAGDFCKEASDVGLPLVAVGFMYPQGYFHQHISGEGWQEEVYDYLDFTDMPISPVFSADGGKVVTQIQLEDRTLSVAVWQVRVGCSTVYLLDTNIDENAARDREFSARLYVADSEMRIEQEIVLGIGGVRIIRALGIDPAIWHANEAHTAFMILERVREEVAGGTSFSEAVRRVQQTTVFTTHSPVLATQDVFPIRLVEKYFHGYWESLGLSREDFLKLGQYDGSGGEAFSMAALALRMANQRNAVSQLHGRTARKIWHGLWPNVREEEVPISSVTNGIHVLTWVARELLPVYEKYLGQDWLERQDDTQVWERILDVPDDELWAIHQALKHKLVAAIVERVQNRWAENQLMAKQVVAMGALLDSEALTIGFCRRFTEYKRPGLIFQDIERLKKIVTDRFHPVQIIFAGKSHPADLQGKQFIHEMYELALDQRFLGRIAFIEDYDMHIAHYLVQGVDVWLNTPQRLEEACGTSGMKAALNGVLHLSVLDGWWYEGYNGKNGWAIDKGSGMSTMEQDYRDAQTIYRFLEEEIVPLYYDRDASGIPKGWVQIMKEAIHSIVPHFCARRMLKEYTEQLYVAAAAKNLTS